MMSLVLRVLTIYDIKKQIKVLRFISTVMWLVQKQHIGQSQMMWTKCCYCGSKWHGQNAVTMDEISLNEDFPFDHYMIMAQAKLFHKMIVLLTVHKSINLHGKTCTRNIMMSFLKVPRKLQPIMKKNQHQIKYSM